MRPAERVEIGKTFAEIGHRYGMTVKACAEGNDLAPYGIDCTGCMTIETFETALHCHDAKQTSWIDRQMSLF